MIAQEVASAQNNTDVDAPPTAATTCPVPSPPPKDTLDDPVCSLCPEGMVLDPAMKEVAPQQEYAAEIAKALAQAGQSEFIPVVLSFVTCGCESLEYVSVASLLIHSSLELKNNACCFSSSWDLEIFPVGQRVAARMMVKARAVAALDLDLLFVGRKKKMEIFSAAGYYHSVCSWLFRLGQCR